MKYVPENNDKLVEFALALIGGIAVMYFSYLLLSYAPVVWHIRVDTYAEVFAVLTIVVLGTLALVCKRYAALIGFIVSYPVFYIVLIILLAIGCTEGNCL